MRGMGRVRVACQRASSLLRKLHARVTLWSCQTSLAVVVIVCTLIGPEGMRSLLCLLSKSASYFYLSMRLFTLGCSRLATPPAVLLPSISPCQYTRCAQAGEPDRALQAFRGLQRSGLQPNLVTWCVAQSPLQEPLQAPIAL